MDLRKKYAQLFEGKIRSNDKFLFEARRPKYWDSQFAMMAIEAYKKGEFKLTDEKSILKWDTKMNGGIVPRPPFNTKELIMYALETGKKPDGTKMNETVNEAYETPDIHELLTSYIDSIETVAESIRELEQEVAGGLEMYEEETGDYRVTQLMNQTSRYCQSAERNLDALQRMLKRKKDILG